ncbi:ABC transporter [candidate division TA06 bacterium DG_24]|jgi:ABC-2 type transport system permease protein|uniref:ABC transporter n=3 Tax=Bacteria division TA06 TaxID=1156500 RepID=A0A0S8JPS7_UNCT6|nr:MAG: ABC transporter [candidate division TA06 bacterium DG_24]KPK71209.1 MAG: ABC transporter [candidate division TA06 bacterium SM23_40]KPL11458.1 MAG: ABC transporter [candidate division TA06 bacterium SM1_40]
MTNTLTVFKKEFRTYFASPMGYIYITVFLVATNWLFLRGFFLINQASLRGFFGVLPWIFLLFVPAVTMRLWAEERKVGTAEVLMTLPLRDHEIVLGKFLASLAFVAISLALTLVLPITTAIIGSPDTGSIIGGYIGALLLGAAYLAIGIFASGLTENQIVAFIVGIAICFVLLVLGENIVLFTLPTPLVPVFEFLGLGAHFRSISRGVLDSRDIVYYLSVVVLFLYLNLRTLENQR